ncbi:MAG: ABC transporter permease [Acetobacteraceae bacterium]|nr:ABC transporter permease [Acetobacteraceae bacterium]
MPLLSQFLDGLSVASPLFLLGAGLSLSIGLTRFVNLSHGSLAVLGAYAACSVTPLLPPAPSSLLLAILAAAILVGVGGAVLEIVLFRRLYRAPLFRQLLGTIGLLLVLYDAALAVWGTGVISLPVIPGRGVRMAAGALVGAALLLILHGTRWGQRVRAASADTARLRTEGPDPWLATGVAGLAALLAGLAGALSGRAAPSFDLSFLSGAILVSLAGGFGSVAGAGLAALAIGLLQTLTVTQFPGLTLLPALCVATIVLIVRPAGLLGRPYGEPPFAADPLPIRPAPLSARLLGCAVLLLAALTPFLATPGTLSVFTALPIAVLFVASLHLIAGPGGIPSLGQAAFFGIGAYAAVGATQQSQIGFGPALLAAPLVAGAAAFLVGALTVPLPAIATAMATLATAQALWQVAIGHPSLDLAGRPAWATGPTLYWLTLALCVGGTLWLRRLLYAPFGYALRALRDDPARAAALGLPRYRIRLTAFTLAGAVSGLAGGPPPPNPGPAPAPPI